MPGNAIGSEITETMLMPAAAIAAQVSRAYLIASELGMEQDTLWLSLEQSGYSSPIQQPLDKLLGKYGPELAPRISSYRLHHGKFYVQGRTGGPVEFSYPHFFWESVAAMEGKAQSRPPGLAALSVLLPVEVLASFSELGRILRNQGAERITLLFPPHTLNDLLAGLRCEVLLPWLRNAVVAQLRF